MLWCSILVCVFIWIKKLLVLLIRYYFIIINFVFCEAWFGFCCVSFLFLFADFILRNFWLSCCCSFRSWIRVHGTMMKKNKVSLLELISLLFFTFLFVSIGRNKKRKSYKNVFLKKFSEFICVFFWFPITISILYHSFFSCTHTHSNLLRISRMSLKFLRVVIKLESCLQFCITVNNKQLSHCSLKLEPPMSIVLYFDEFCIGPKWAFRIPGFESHHMRFYDARAFDG